MEDFIIENLERFRSLVDKFKPASKPPSAVAAAPSRDIVVSARVRPPSEEELSTGFPTAAFLRPEEVATLDVHELKKAIRGPPTLKSSSYDVDHAFGPDATTEQLYEDVVKHLVPWAWGGGIGTLFAYGQTGSGKTFTITRLEQLVATTLMDGGLGGNRKIYVSIIELAGNSAHDLLNGRRPVSVLEDSFGVVQLAGALEQNVTSRDDILGIVETATKFRRTESTEKNDASSRSHAICRIRIEILDIENAEDGMLYLIDLAGSEAARDREKHGADRMREAREINTSLSVLKDCIRGKAEADALLGASSSSSKRKPHVPFRHSALTKVLKHVFDPTSMKTSKTVVVACVNPSLADIAATKNTLRYAEMLRVFVAKPKGLRYNPEAPVTWTNEQLKEWIETNSGTPPVSAHLLAPTESGSIILRLPYPEFELRCLKTPGVIPEQARAFRSKLWQMHVDSQRAKSSKAPGAADSAEADTVIGYFNAMDSSSSRDKHSDTKAVPFKERIRPGMAVSWTPPTGFHIDLPDGLRMVVVLCPAHAVGDHVKDGSGRLVNPPDQAGEASDARYLCALVLPAIMPGAYDVQLWQQVVVDLEMMNAEVLLEFDSATRYYYLAV